MVATVLAAAVVLPWAAWVVDHEHDVDAISLYKLHEEGAVALGVETHALHVF